MIDQLLAALSRQKITVQTENATQLFVYDEAHKREVIEQAGVLRKSGNFVELIPYDTAHKKADYEAYAKRTGITQITYKIGE